MTKKLNAAERITALEQKIISQSSQIEEIAKIIDEVDRKFLALAKRVNATISASNNHSAVDEIIQTENAKELKNMVDNLVEMGGLSLDEKATIGETSFVVGRHISKEGNEITPRLQFYVGSLAQEEILKFVGKKVGDMIDSEDGSVSIEITELYKVNDLDKEFKEESKEEIKETEEKPSESKKSDSK